MNKKEQIKEMSNLIEQSKLEIFIDSFVSMYFPFIYNPEMRAARKLYKNNFRKLDEDLFRDNKMLVRLGA